MNVPTEPDWITDAPPAEWKAGMLILARDYRGQETVEVIGSVTLVTEYDRTLDTSWKVPGTEHDFEGPGIDRFYWMSASPHAYCAYVIVGWNPGMSDLPIGKPVDRAN